MQEICTGLEFYSKIMGSIPTNTKATSHAKMNGSMVDVDLDYEPPTSTVDEFRKKFMDIRKSVLLSAG
jgi:hypothetical protein